MTIEMFEKFVRDNNLVIRTIPKRVKSAFDPTPENVRKYPQGVIKHMSKYGRNMLVVSSVPNHAGEFLVVRATDTMCNVDFSGGVYFKSFNEIYEYYSAVKGEEE